MKISNVAAFLTAVMIYVTTATATIVSAERVRRTEYSTLISFVVNALFQEFLGPFFNVCPIVVIVDILPSHSSSFLYLVSIRTCVTCSSFGLPAHGILKAKASWTRKNTWTEPLRCSFAVSQLLPKNHLSFTMARNVSALEKKISIPFGYQKRMTLSSPGLNARMRRFGDSVKRTKTDTRRLD